VGSFRKWGHEFIVSMPPVQNTPNPPSLTPPTRGGQPTPRLPRLQRAFARLSYGNVVATIALFISLGGASYAAVSLPHGSVGPRQLRQGAVTPRALGFPLGAREFTDTTPIDLHKGPCNSPPPQGSPPVDCADQLVIEEHALGTVDMRSSGQTLLSAVVELANEGPAGSSADVSLALVVRGSTGGGRADIERRVANVGGQQTIEVPLQALIGEAAGAHSVGFSTSGATYSSSAPGDLMVRWTSIIVTALPAL
jgi:hypothetical protein